MDNEKDIQSVPNSWNEHPIDFNRLLYIRFYSNFSGWIYTAILFSVVIIILRLWPIMMKSCVVPAFFFVSDAI